MNSDTYEREVKILMYREVDIKGKKLFKLCLTKRHFTQRGWASWRCGIS